MADLSGAHMVGEAIVALLRTRRQLLDQSNLLGPVSSSQDIAQASVGKLVSNQPPTGGLSLTCYHMARSQHGQSVRRGADAAAGNGISLELHYLLACWSGTAGDELALMSWAMLELNRYPVIGPGQLPGTGWGRDEMIQLSPGDESPDQLFRIWDGFKTKYRLSTTLRARVLRIGYGAAPDGPPVVASRFAFAHGDVAMEPAA